MRKNEGPQIKTKPAQHKQTVPLKWWRKNMSFRVLCPVKVSFKTEDGITYFKSRTCWEFTVSRTTLQGMLKGKPTEEWRPLGKASVWEHLKDCECIYFLLLCIYLFSSQFIYKTKLFKAKILTLLKAL